MRPVVRPDGKARITAAGQARLGCCCGCACCFYNPDGTFNYCQGMKIQDCLAAGGYPARTLNEQGQDHCLGSLCCEDPEAPPPCYYCPRTVQTCSNCSTKLPNRVTVSIPPPEWCGPGEPPEGGWGYSVGCQEYPTCEPGTGGPTCWEIWCSLWEAYAAAIGGTYVLPVSYCFGSQPMPEWDISVTGDCCGQGRCRPGTWSTGGGALSVTLWAQKSPPPPPYVQRFYVSINVQAVNYAQAQGTSAPIAELPWVGGDPPLLDCRGIAALVPLVSTYGCGEGTDRRPRQYEWNGVAVVAFA